MIKKIKYESYKCNFLDSAILKLDINSKNLKNKYIKFKGQESYLRALAIKISNNKKYFIFDPQLIGNSKKVIVINKYDIKKFNLKDCKSYLADISQLNNVYETTKELEKILINLKLLKKGKNIVDFGCGFGSAIQYLSSKHPNIRFFGCDKNKKILEIAKTYTDNKNLRYLYQDFLNFKKNKLLENISCVFNIHTLCCFKNPQKFIKSTTHMKPEFIIIKSLFYDGPINTFIHTEDLGEANKKNIDGDLNIFSKQMIIDFYKKLNYKYISYKPFFIKKKLTRDKKSGRKSYTIKFNNRLNTFTGPVYLPWGFIIFKKK